MPYNHPNVYSTACFFVRKCHHRIHRLSYKKQNHAILIYLRRTKSDVIKNKTFKRTARGFPSCFSFLYVALFTIWERSGTVEAIKRLG